MALLVVVVLEVAAQSAQALSASIILAQHFQLFYAQTWEFGILHVDRWLDVSVIVPSVFFAQTGDFYSNSWIAWPLTGDCDRNESWGSSEYDLVDQKWLWEISMASVLKNLNFSPAVLGGLTCWIPLLNQSPRNIEDLSNPQSLEDRIAQLGDDFWNGFFSTSTLKPEEMGGTHEKKQHVLPKGYLIPLLTSAMHGMYRVLLINFPSNDKAVFNLWRTLGNEAYSTSEWQLYLNSAAKLLWRPNQYSRAKLQLSFPCLAMAVIISFDTLLSPTSNDPLTGSLPLFEVAKCSFWFQWGHFGGNLILNYTLPETNIFAPENWWLVQMNFLLGPLGLFLGAFSVGFRFRVASMSLVNLLSFAQGSASRWYCAWASPGEPLDLAIF